MKDWAELKRLNQEFSADILKRIKKIPNEAERLRLSISAAPFTIGEKFLTVTCSVGLACLPVTVRRNTDSLIRAADLALYSAKAKGRNQIACADTVMMGAK